MIHCATHELVFRNAHIRNGYVWIYYETPACNTNFICLTLEEFKQIEDQVTLSKLEKELTNETN